MFAYCCQQDITLGDMNIKTRQTAMAGAGTEQGPTPRCISALPLLFPATLLWFHLSLQGPGWVWYTHMETSDMPFGNSNAVVLSRDTVAVSSSMEQGVGELTPYEELDLDLI